tara:strand:+ start:341 stop:499 length:159 start_codon:yes stop_codon:yes gene_type:complete
MIIRSNNTFELVRTITDQLLLVVKGPYKQPVLRSWHVSKLDEALSEWEDLTK